MIGDELAQLPHERRVLKLTEVGLDAVLEGHHAPFLEADGRTERELAIGELGQGRTAPQRQTLAEHPLRSEGVVGIEQRRPLVGEHFEAAEVDLLDVDVEPVSRRVRQQHRRVALGIAVRLQGPP